MELQDFRQQEVCQIDASVSELLRQRRQVKRASGRTTFATHTSNPWDIA
jgi:hypothetical protein